MGGMGQQAGAQQRYAILGVLSDTHGHLYQGVKKALQGVEHIIHAGDIGSPQVLEQLRSIAPLTAVRGNCDLDSWAQALPLQADTEISGVRILVAHIAARLQTVADSAGHAIVITGHSHVAALERRGGRIYLNPGAAGPRRFNRPRTVARITIPLARPDAAAEAEAEDVDVTKIGVQIIPVQD